MEKQGLHAFWLKILAIVGMTFNHIGVIFYNELPFLPKIFLFFCGGFTFPIMAFLLVEGYRHTRNVYLYALRMLLFAVATQIPVVFVYGLSYTFNIFFTLLLGLIALYGAERMKPHLSITNYGFFHVLFNALLCLCGLGALVWLSGFCDWAYYGVPLVLGFWFLRGRYIRVVLPIVCLSIAFVWNIVPIVLQYGILNALPIFQALGCLTMIPFLLQYNKQRGPNWKYFFYCYYPIHMGVLYLIHELFFSK